MGKVYDSAVEARKACERYETAVRELQEEMGITETYEDESAGVWVRADFRTEDGMIGTYTN